MTPFNKFNEAIRKNVNRLMKTSVALQADVERDELWDIYLRSFPEGTNPTYKERTEHDCNCCKQFIRNFGGTVFVNGGKVDTIWNVKTGDFYEEVAREMHMYVSKKAIRNIYMHTESVVGGKPNVQLLENNDTIKWEHFNFKLPSELVNGDKSRILGDASSNYSVLKRSLEELTVGAGEIVVDLIDQNSLYRGEEHRSIVNKFLQLKSKYDKLKTRRQKELFLWEQSVKMKHAGRIKNTVIGTLLADLSDGVDLERAVKSFEDKVAPYNYKRPKALITKSMVKNAEKKVAELGIEDSLKRRFAVAEDITINNVLFADRSAKKKMGVFDELMDGTVGRKPSMDKVEEVSVSDFVEKVLPKADTVEIMVENRHGSNFMSVIAPEDPDSKNILKWGNNFSWTYNGDATDSIKEKVKTAGGTVDGFLRCSLAWSNFDDLDIHVVEPTGSEIYYGDRKGQSGGTLDVDMNAGGRNSRTPVENIIWKNRSRMQEGLYEVYVHNYAKREAADVGFVLEVEVDGDVHTFEYPKAVDDKKRVSVVKFEYTHKNGVKVVDSIPSTTSTKEIWGINTNDFRKVSMVMQSPNHWDDNDVGNRHWFFIMEGCLNPDKARGLYNEFLTPELNEHRKVFEVLGSKIKAEHSEDQLSGLGFSSTKDDAILCRVSGKFNRVIKVKF